jgi:hypothetical protein
MSASTTRVLTNLYLPPAEGYVLRTFGDYLPGGPDPAWRAEKERRPLAEILPLIPASERPDILIITSPEYLPIPVDVADFPGLRILLITDWNVCLRFLPDLCPLFDFCFTDWPGYRLLRKAGVRNVHHQPLFGHDPAAFLDQGKPRNLDVSFCGNLNAGLHGERNRLLARLGAWGAARPGRSIHLGQAFNQDYLDVLNRSRLVFNYSIRGEANMRLFEAMACGAVPLVEASNQEAAILFQEGRHYFRYEPGTLEATIASLLADPARIAAVAAAARAAVARHTKADQIRSLLDHAVRESGKTAALGNSDVTEAPPPGGPGTASILSPRSLKALIKLRVLGAAYTMPEALAELQSREEGLPGLAAETLPAALISLIENHPGESFSSAHSILDLILTPDHRPAAVNDLLKLRLSAQRGRWDEVLERSQACQGSMDAVERTSAQPGDPSGLSSLYDHFYPPVDLGKGLNTDLNHAFRLDLPRGIPHAYADLMRARCLADRARALLALGRPREALEAAERIPAGRFVSVDPRPLMAECCALTGDRDRECAVVAEWYRERPLDTSAWEKRVQSLERAGRSAELLAFLKEILVLSRHFLPPEQVEAVRMLVESRRG